MIPTIIHTHLDVPSGSSFCGSSCSGCVRGNIFADYGVGLNLSYTLAGGVLAILGLGLIYYALVLQGKARLVKHY